MMFCNHDYMSLFENWELHAKEMLARFHATFARYIDDAWFNGFIQDMKNKSEAFASWWALYDIYSMSNIVKNLMHPSLGKLTFDFINFEAPDNQGLKLLIYNPDDETRPVMATCPV